MPGRPLSVRPVDAVADGLAAIRAELALPGSFPPDVQAEAEAASRAWRAPSTSLDLPFVTIDPPGARDLDQAMHLARRGDGHRVTYAIADVGAWVAPGGAVDREAHARATTVYLPEQKVPLHPPVLSEDAGSLLPGVDRPAIVWTLDLDGAGELIDAHVERAVVRSTAQFDYEHVPEEVRVLLAEVGERRIAVERARGGVSLRVPEQEVVRLDDGSWSVAYRAPLATEDHNAQVSLLTGMAAAGMMLDGGIGLLRTQPDPEPKALHRLRAAAQGLGLPWAEGVPYTAWVATLDPAVPAHAALLHQAAGVGHGAGYTAFDGSPPEQRRHFAIAAPYAHVTAPLRRMADRYALECCVALCAGRPVPDWVRAALPALPKEMSAGAQRAGKAERAVVDLVEATLLAGRVGEVLDAVAVDDDLIALEVPAVRARIPKAGLTPGTRVRVRVEAADVTARTVTFAIS